MKPLSISRLIFDTVPQLYQATDGRYPVDLHIEGETARIFAMAPLSPAIKSYLERAVKIWEDLSPMTEGDVSQIIEREWIQQKFIVDWLESKTNVTSWGTILDYFRRLSRRLTENQAMAKTIVIERGHPDGKKVKLSDAKYFKVFDWLGSSSHTYFRVTDDLEIKSLEVLSLTDVKEPEGFRFYPDVLHPVMNSLKETDVAVVHLSENGSILIADRKGLIASKRGLDSWTIYDADHVIDSVAEAMKRQLTENACATEPGCVACSLFQVLFDICMKRHGGLIILDSPANLPQYVIKGIERDSDSPLNAIFTHSPLDGLQYSLPEVRKLVELSCIDGALILDLYGNLVQVGSMVVPHPSTLNRFGTREAAGYSAARHGATAFKISADGHMSMFFTTPEFTGSEVHHFHFR